MLVYKCPGCGVTYDKKNVPQSEMCPSCEIYLKIVDMKIESDSLEESIPNAIPKVGRMPSKGQDQMSVEWNLDDNQDGEDVRRPESETEGLYDNSEERIYTRNIYKSANKDVIEGTIISAFNDNGYHRLPWEKLFDRFYYSQNVSDIQNSIYVRCTDENGNIKNNRIIIYGQLKGGIEIIRTGMKIIGEGKYNSQNEFVAKNLVIEDNINLSVRIEASDIIYYASPLLLTLIIIFSYKFVKIMQEILESPYLKWILIGIAAVFFLLFGLIGRRRASFTNRLRLSLWILIIFVIIHDFTTFSIKRMPHRALSCIISLQTKIYEGK